jgi:hypothetical protein
MVRSGYWLKRVEDESFNFQLCWFVLKGPDVWRHLLKILYANLEEHQFVKNILSRVELRNLKLLLRNCRFPNHSILTRISRNELYKRMSSCCYLIAYNPFFELQKTTPRSCSKISGFSRTQVRRRFLQMNGDSSSPGNAFLPG